jgi:tetratricopeptide (TPR) repeat protein
LGGGAYEAAAEVRMLRAGSVAGLALAVAACAPAQPDLLREYNDDGVRLFERGAYADARESFETALTLRPGDPNLLYDVGQCYDRLGKAAPAEQRYTQCLAREPGHAECRHALAELLLRQGRRSEAVGMVEDWLRRQPELAAAYAEDGWLWHQFGDLPRAQARLQQALDRDPRDNRALLELAAVYEDLHRPDRAAVLYERALEYRPHQPEVEHRLAGLRAGGAGRPHPD